MRDRLRAVLPWALVAVGAVLYMLADHSASEQDHRARVLAAVAALLVPLVALAVWRGVDAGYTPPPKAPDHR